MSCSGDMSRHPSRPCATPAPGFGAPGAACCAASKRTSRSRLCTLRLRAGSDLSNTADSCLASTSTLTSCPFPGGAKSVVSFGIWTVVRKGVAGRRTHVDDVLSGGHQPRVAGAAGHPLLDDRALRRLVVSLEHRKAAVRIVETAGIRPARRATLLRRPLLVNAAARWAAAAIVTPRSPQRLARVSALPRAFTS